MDTHYGKKEDRSGVRLISLLGNHLKEILKRESDNRAFVPTRTLDGYKEWHKEEVRCFPMPEVKTTSMDRDMEID